MPDLVDDLEMKIREEAVAGIVGVTGYLVAEREPANSGLWRDLCEESGIVFAWPDSFAQDIPRSDGGLRGLLL